MSIAQPLGGSLTREVPMDAANQVQVVEITVRINAYAFLFGIPLLLTVIILGTLVASGSLIRQPEIRVEAPRVEARITVPPATVNNTIHPSDVPVTVNVPAQSPTVNVPRQEPSNISFNMPEGKGQVQVIEKVVEKTRDVPVPVYVETIKKGAVTLADIFPVAEKYVEGWCVKNGKDAKAEAKRWMELWSGRVTERGDEQAVFTDALIEKRGGFDVAKAKPSEVVEVCRLMLRLRDAELSIPSVFRDHVSAANLLAFKAFLERGVQP